MRTFTRGALLAAASTLSLHAQCYDQNTGATVGTGDDIVLAAQTLPFAFPFNGATYSTIHPCTNGFVYLSNGSTTGGSLCCTGTVALLTAAVSPMIAPWWSDLNMVSGTGAVKYDGTATRAAITWENAIEYTGSTATGTFTVQLLLYPTGEFDFIYDSRVAVRNGHTFLTGMSPGAGATAGAASVFTTAGVGTTNTNYELSGPAIGPVALASKGIHFVPTNPGFVWVPTSCSANHSSYGQGCYNLAASFYQFTNTAAAVTALSNSAITLLNTGNGYTVLPIGTYVAPSPTATTLALTDDSETTVTLTNPFPYFGGTTPTLTVCSNGFVSVATGNGVSYTADAPAFLAAPQTAWRSWKDFNPSVAGSGQIKFEEVGTTAYVTWDGVANYGGTSADVNTQQFQFDTATGHVVIAWGQMSLGAPTTGAGYLVGYSPGGPSIDPGSITIPGGLPVSTANVDFGALALAASPNPISTPSSGTVVTYITSNIPEFAPTSGLYVAINILSLGQVPAPGLDLGFLGAPGCPALVQSLDVTQAMVGASATQSVAFNLPAGVLAGTLLYAQSAALFTPNSLPNGQNAFGLTTSNGIASFINGQ